MMSQGMSHRPRQFLKTCFAESRVRKTAPLYTRASTARKPPTRAQERSRKSLQRQMETRQDKRVGQLNDPGWRAALPF